MKPAPYTPRSEMSDPFASARALLDGIKRHTAFALAGQIALGIELVRLKNDLGYTHGGDRKSSPHRVDLKPAKTWTAWVNQELGISDETARRFMAMAEYVRPQLKKLGGPSMLAILEKPVADVTDSDRESIMALVGKCTDAQTQAEFLKEIGYAKSAVPLQGGASGKEPTPPDREQLLLQLFAEPLAHFVNTFASPTAEEALWKIPLTADKPDCPSLASIESALSTELARVRNIRKKRESGHSLSIDV